MTNCVHPEAKFEEQLPTEPKKKKRMCAYLRNIESKNLEKGIVIGKAELNDEHIRSMIALGLPPEQISKITGVSVEELKERYGCTDTEPVPSPGS